MSITVLLTSMKKICLITGQMCKPSFLSWFVEFATISLKVRSNAKLVKSLFVDHARHNGLLKILILVHFAEISHSLIRSTEWLGISSANLSLDVSIVIEAVLKSILMKIYLSTKTVVLLLSSDVHSAPLPDFRRTKEIIIVLSIYLNNCLRCK